MEDEGDVTLLVTPMAYQIPGIKLKTYLGWRQWHDLTNFGNFRCFLREFMKLTYVAAKGSQITGPLVTVKLTVTVC